MPNTKSKKFDFTILLASLSIVLVICCAVICCVFGIGSDNQVAYADEITTEDLLIDDDRIIMYDVFADYPWSNNCIYFNSSFNFSLLEEPIRELIDYSFNYDDIFIYPIATVERSDYYDGVHQILFLSYWEGNCDLILSTDEYISQILNFDLLNSYDSYTHFQEDYLSNFTFSYVDFYVTETDFFVGAVHHFQDFDSIYNLDIDTIYYAGINFFEYYVLSLINTAPYFSTLSRAGVLYSPITEDGYLTINPYITKIDYRNLTSFVESFDFSTYSPLYTDDGEDFYSIIDGSVDGLDFTFGYSSTGSDFAYFFDSDFYFLNSENTIGPFVFSSYQYRSDLLTHYRYEIIDIKPLFYDIQYYLNYELDDGYCFDLGLLLSSTHGYLTPSYISACSYADWQIALINANHRSEIDDLEGQISNRDELIDQLREELEYYRSLDLNYQEIQVFNIARCKPSTFVYDGVTYTSNSIVRTNDGWDVYSSTYLNEQLPDNYGVGFSLFLEETIVNSKFHIYPDILSWYNYTYCSPLAQDGSQECYQVNERNIDFSVGYRTQNGNIVKIGEFSNAPGMTTGNFVINQPTNEIVFFREESNLMQIGNLFSLLTYQFDTESIYNDGYENGKFQGIQIGRQEGYNQGVLDANDYSFFSLFTSVFDAPISAIVGKWGDSDGDGVYQREGGMLNFYIPGLDINFAPFLLSLFTIAIIILVIRFIMARKS